MNPQYPVYIISKGRWESRLTSKALEAMGVPYHIVVEPQELENYAAVIQREKILVLPFSNLGLGGIPARNWVWEHSLTTGAKRHWIMDDNIKAFIRQNHSERITVRDGTALRAMEDFCDRYENIALAGPGYFFMGNRAPASCEKNPFLLNTRIYSCLLILNCIPYRWRGRYNEDTDLSLRALKDGWCTIQFWAFMQAKTATMTMKVGNTDQLYKQDEKIDGRLEMAKSLQLQHPDVARITRKWGRWQHHVDYRSFKKNRLRKVPGLKISSGCDEYGMRLVSDAHG